MSIILTLCKVSGNWLLNRLLNADSDLINLIHLTLINTSYFKWHSSILAVKMFLAVPFTAFVSYLVSINR